MNINNQELEDAGPAPYVKRTINANRRRCQIVQLNFRLIITVWVTFVVRGCKKVSGPVERLRVVFRKKAGRVIFKEGKEKKLVFKEPAN